MIVSSTGWPSLTSTVTEVCNRLACWATFSSSSRLGPFWPGGSRQARSRPLALDGSSTVKFASMSTAPSKLASSIVASVKSAPTRVACRKSALLRSARLNLASVRSALQKVALFRFAPVKSLCSSRALLRSAEPRSAPWKFEWLKVDSQSFALRRIACVNWALPFALERVAPVKSEPLQSATWFR